MTDHTDRNYNVNEFDWEGKEEAIQDQAGITSVESLIHEALGVATEHSDAWLKPSDVNNDRARIVYNVPYNLGEQQKEHMKELIGDVRTITFNATGYHDHPLSHCTTEIAEDLVVRKFCGERFVSVYGNASRHNRLGHTNAKVVSDRVVPHDWFRNRGLEQSVTMIDSFVMAGGHLKYRLFLATHALYYMSLEDVACWLGANNDAEFHAIIHRHDKSKGYLNKGEIRYTVDSDGIVNQVNPVGLSYKHRTMEPLFHVDSCQLFGGRVGLAWDITRTVGDCYHVKFVLCAPDKASPCVDPWALVKKEREVFVRGDVTVYRMLGFEWYVYHACADKVVLEDVELYDRLRRTIAGKERTPRAKADLMTMCRRLANKNDIISIHQGYAHDVPPELITYYVNAAFYADVKTELEVALKYHRENKAAVDALNKYMTEGVVPLDMTIVAQVGRAVSAPFHELVGLLKDHSREIGTDLVSGRENLSTEYLPPDPFGLHTAQPEYSMLKYLMNIPRPPQ